MGKKQRYTLYTKQVADYEHSGDLNNEITHIKHICPKAIKFKSWEERDYEAEAYYAEEYGEIDEPIYQGFISFEAPEDCEELLNDYDCY